jgi:predicted NAD/FAD-binding protein
VIGSGVAGLTAAHVLGRQARVTLYEADARLGGHADTHVVDGIPVDTGFIVHNERTYPNLMRLFDELGVETQASDMSMSVRSDEYGLEWAGALGLGGLFPTWRNALRPSYLRMLVEIPRFHRMAKRLLATSDESRGSAAETLESFLERGHFSSLFRTHFMESLVACVWSCDPAVALDYPARYLFTFLENHGALSVKGSPVWYTVVGGSARYVERAAKGLTAVQTSTPVRAVTRVADGVEIRDDADEVVHFDAAVLATHPHQALGMLTAPTADERDVLGAIGYTVNPTLLHTDTSVLPRTRRAAASWNYAMPSCRALPTAVHVSYDMNRLQRLHAPETYIVTLNGDDRVDPAKVIDRMTYEHPIYTMASVAARERLPELNDSRLAFAGAYHGWGFHEDGCRSGVAAAASLGVDW